MRSDPIRRIETQALADTPAGELMRRAARAVADAALALLWRLPAGTPVVALCGPGNNGGDALLAAMMLEDAGFAARALLLPATSNPPADALRVLTRAHRRRFALHTVEAPCQAAALLQETGTPPPLVIDGLFGIGLARPLDGVARTLAEAANDLAAAMVAVDVPSGIAGDTGSIVGRSHADGSPRPLAIRADCTVTMIADKPGLHTGAACDHAGAVIVASIGLGDAVSKLAGAMAPAAVATPARVATASALVEHASTLAKPASTGGLFGRSEASTLAPRRHRNSNKGDHGGVLVVGGASGMSGAALLAARGAGYCGAGKVWIASPAGPVFDPGEPQWMTRDPRGDFRGVNAIAIGCGLGTSEEAATLLERVLRATVPAVLDADALNRLAADPLLGRALALRTAPHVLTPHPLEAARLLGASVHDIQRDRIHAAVLLAQRYAGVAVLKGAGTVVATPDGNWSLIGAGGPALATAGTGDVLAGAIAALLAQGLAADQAATLGCWLHGDAGDRWAADTGHEVGLAAVELPRWMRASLAALFVPDVDRGNSR